MTNRELGGAAGPGSKESRPKSAREHDRQPPDLLAHINKEMDDLRILLGAKKEKATPAKEFKDIFNLIFTNAAEQPGVTRQELYKETGWSRRQINRFITGESLPPVDYYDKTLIPGIEKASKRPVEAKLRTKGRELLTEAHEFPRTIREKYESEKNRFAELSARMEAGAARISVLRGEIELLGQQLIDLAFGGTIDPDGWQVVRDSDALAQLQSLRARLAKAKAELATALEQQNEDGMELRQCARQLIEIVDEVDQYLEAIIDGEIAGQEG